MRRHPWLFEGSVAKLDGRARPGDTVEVVSHDGRSLGRAAYSPRSQIRARMWSFDTGETIDDAFFKRRVAASVARRAALPELRDQSGLRLIHGESDGLPGIIADRYGDTVVLALTSAGAEKWRDAIVAAVLKATGCARIYERSDSEVRGLEGLEPATGVLHGPPIDGAAGDRRTWFAAGGRRRGRPQDRLLPRSARESPAVRRTGRPAARCSTASATPAGFPCRRWQAARPTALSIDSSGPALASAQRNLALNPQLDAARAQWLEADVFSALRELRAAGRRFDLIVLDPPKFAPSAAHADRAARAYKDINLLGFRLLNPGGLLMSYSCSGGVGLELFQKIVAGAASDAGVDARILRRLGASADHPVGLAFPEGEYLKGLLCQVA